MPARYAGVYPLDHYRSIGWDGGASEGGRRQIERNWKVIAASTGNSPAYYANVREHRVISLFDVRGPDRLTDIATVFAAAPYDLRAGWPDLTRWQDGKVKFVEVKHT